MYVYAGIDEAGYGPMFGPFVVSRTVFTVDTHDAASGPPPLWSMMSSALCRSKGDKRRRIAVNDSKKLYTPSSGPATLERGVLAFAHLAGRSVGTLDQLLRSIGDDDSRVPDLLWYADASGGPALPASFTAGELAVTRAMLERSARSAGVSLADVSASVVYEDRFNQIIAATRSKGRCAWTFVSRHLWTIWQKYGEHSPFVCVDRQGGRKVYHELLQRLFEGASLRLLDESDDVSRYVLTDTASGRSMTVSFEIGSEQSHLPVALASMTAKYVRELLMGRFNAFWARHDPQLKPTAGYVQDGRRFLSQIETAIDAMGIDRRQLIRVC